jgi:hypothetical protein
MTTISIYTVGYGNRSIEDFVKLLQDNQISGRYTFSTILTLQP